MLTDISQRILDIDLRYAHSPDPDLYKERHETEFSLLLTDEALCIIFRHNVLSSDIMSMNRETKQAGC